MSKIQRYDNSYTEVYPYEDGPLVLYEDHIKIVEKKEILINLLRGGAERLHQHIEKLHQQIEALKCCGNCKHYGCNDHECVFMRDFTSGSDKCEKWEISG